MSSTISTITNATYTLTAGGYLDITATGAILPPAGYAILGVGLGTVNNAGTVVQTGTGARGANAYNDLGLTGGAGGGGTAAIALSQGGTIDNSGAIAGGAGGGGGAGYYGGTGGMGGAGILLSQPGSIDNNGGTISGGRGGAGGNAFIYFYGGSINGVPVTGGVPGFLAGYGGTGGTGIVLSQGGTIVNSGTIAGGADGAIGTGAHSGFFTGSIGVSLGGTGTVVNAGAISGSLSAVLLRSGGTVSNSAGGVIAGTGRGGVGVKIAGADGTVANAGVISGGLYGVQLQRGGYVSNSAGGVISGRFGIGVTGAAGTVSNAGSIVGSNGYAVQLQGGNVSNSAGAVISGFSSGVIVSGAAGTISNTGAIQATSNNTRSPLYAVLLRSGGTVSNSAGGVMSGVRGITVAGAAGTVSNAGTIIGTAGRAVRFLGRGTNRLIVDPGAVFIGTANGSGSNDVLELAPGASSGTVTGLGTTRYLGFGHVTVDAGADWTLAGSSAAATGIALGQNSTLAVATSLTGSGGTAVSFAGSGAALVLYSGASLQGEIDGFLAGETIDLRGGGVAAGFLSLGSGNILTVPASGGGSIALHLDPNRNYAQYRFAASADGFGGSDITTAFDPGPTAGTGATTVGHDKPIDLTGFVTGLVTPGLPGDTDTIVAAVVQHGTATIVNGVLTYTAPSTGPDALTYTVENELGEMATASVAITVDPGPAAGAGATTVGHNKFIDLTGFVSGLVTPGLPGDSDTIVAATAQSGAASVAGGMLTYTAPSTGPDALTYTVSDQYGDTASGSVAITVDPGPAAGAASITVGAGVATDLTSYLLGLDTPGIAGDTLTLSGDNTAGTKGTVSLVNGDLTYTAPAAAATDSFVYTVSDQYGDTASATVTVSAVSLSKVGNGSGTLVLGNNSGSTSFGQGKVTVIAGNGNVAITGGNAGDTVIAGNGNDTIVLGQGSNSVSLGSGNDSITVGNANNTITVAGLPTSTDTIKAGNGNNTLTLGAGTYDVTVGNGQNKFIFRNGGTYDITAGHGVPDLFVFTAPHGMLNLSFGGNDELVFRNAGFDLGADNGLGTATPQAIAASLFSSHSDGSFATAGNRFAYNQATGALSYDAQGSTPGSTSTELVLFGNKPHLSAANLLFTS